jgi:hypothetical protein
MGATSKLVTEELAFRRLLIGAAPGAGLLSIIASTVTAFVWYVLLSRSGVGGSSIIALGTLGAFSAGCLYVLSRSLIVSALYSGLHAAAYWSLEFARTPSGSTTQAGAVSASGWVAAAAVSAALALVVSRRYGFWGNLKQAGTTDVARR